YYVPPFNVTFGTAVAQDGRVYVPVSISQCVREPAAATLAIWSLAGGPVEEASFTPTCGALNVSLPLYPQYVLGGTVFVRANVTFRSGDRLGYVISASQIPLRYNLTLRFLNATLLRNGTVVLTLAYSSPLPLLVSFGSLQVINWNLSAFVVDGCSGQVQGGLLQPSQAGRAYVIVQGCTYENGEAWVGGDLLGVYGRARLTFLSPAGNASLTVGVNGTFIWRGEATP
ncbi:MAG: hypothetical protein ACP5HK_07375, partial [Acidilobus sp.]